MKYSGNRRITKAVKEAARLERETRFADMTDEEIYAEIPNAAAYFYEYAEQREGIGIFVPECPICGATHLHGTGSVPEGLRSPFCLIRDEPIPNNYKLSIDWSDADNIRLATKYRIKK